MSESLNMSLIFGTGLEGLGGNPLTPPEKARKKAQILPKKTKKSEPTPQNFFCFFLMGMQRITVGNLKPLDM